MACALFTALVTCAPADALTTKSFSTTGPVAIPASGPMGLYPWTIPVSGMSGDTVGVDVTLSGLSEQRLSDVDALLTSPVGGKVLFMSDVGDDTTDVPPPGISLTFDDAAHGNVPVGAPVSSGTYRPTNAGTDPDTFPAPAPVAPYGSTLGSFDTGSPNGTWGLYLVSDNGIPATPATGLLQGWSLRITTRTTTTPKPKKPKHHHPGHRRPARGCSRFGSHHRRVRCRCRHSIRFFQRHRRKCHRVLGRHRRISF